jgi:hypothetical protein
MQGKIPAPQITAPKNPNVKGDESKSSTQTLDDLKRQIYNAPTKKKALQSEETWLKKYPVN